MTISSCIAALQKFPGITVKTQGTKHFVYHNETWFKTAYSAGELNAFTQYAMWHWKR